jgi:hypothetical protein
MRTLLRTAIQKGSLPFFFVLVLSTTWRRPSITRSSVEKSRSRRNWGVAKLPAQRRENEPPRKPKELTLRGLDLRLGLLELSDQLADLGVVELGQVLLKAQLVVPVLGLAVKLLDLAPEVSDGPLECLLVLVPRVHGDAELLRESDARGRLVLHGSACWKRERG